jgi:hypothetical protein
MPDIQTMQPTNIKITSSALTHLVLQQVLNAINQLIEGAHINQLLKACSVMVFALRKNHPSTPLVLQRYVSAHPKHHLNQLHKAYKAMAHVRQQQQQDCSCNALHAAGCQ